MGKVATLCRELTADRRDDGELLAAFVSNSSEEAFAELIRRHGPLVWSACRRLLPNPADAEDAFQAAFLVLVRRARRLTRTAALGPWLHRVAVWTARNVRRKNARRFAKQAALPDHVTDPAAPPDPGLKADLDSALLALPSRYRDSIILCHLQGFSRREAAERLGCAEGTLSAWLHRGLAKLRDRLRDFDPKLLGIAVAVPTVLAASTARAAAASIVAGATVPPAVNSLVEGVLHMFWVKKATAATVALFATFVLGVGIGVGTRGDYSAATAGEGPGEAKAAAGEKPKDAPSKQNLAFKITLLEQLIKMGEIEHKFAIEGVEQAKARLELLENAQEPDSREIQHVRFVVAKFQQRAAEATIEIEDLKEKLEILKVAQQKGEMPPSDRAAQVAELEREIKKLKKVKEVAEKVAEVTEQYLKLLKAEKSKPEDIREASAELEKAQREVKEVADKLKAAQDKLAKLKAEEKPAPPAAGEEKLKLQAELLRLQKELALTEETLALKKTLAVDIGQRLKKALDSGNKEAAAEAREALAKAEVAVAEAAKACQILRDQIRVVEEKLKTAAPDKPRPAQPEVPRTHPAFNTLFGKQAELEEQVRFFEREREKLVALALVAAARLQLVQKNGKPEEIKIAAHEAEIAKARADELAVQVYNVRQRFAAAKAMNAPPLKAVGACVEVVVVGGGEPWPCRVREYGRQGKFLGAVIAEDGPALELIMTRAMKDPGGPRDLWLTVSPDQTPEAILQAVEACKKAGFTRISINGKLPQDVAVPEKLK